MPLIMGKLYWECMTTWGTWEEKWLLSSVVLIARGILKIWYLRYACYSFRLVVSIIILHILSCYYINWKLRCLLPCMQESMGLQTILAETNARCFHSILNERMPGIVTLFIGQSDTCVETSTYLLFVELDNDFNQLDATRLLKLQHLRHDITEQPRIPSWTPFQNSRCLKIFGGWFKTL